MDANTETIMEAPPETYRRSAGIVTGSGAEKMAVEMEANQGGTAAETAAETIAETIAEQALEQAGEAPGQVAGFGRGKAPGSKATQFKQRHPGRTVRKPERVKATLKPCQLLRNMRWVFAYQQYRDRTPGQRTCRKWLKVDLKGFMSKLADLEKEFAALVLKERNAGQER
jgi:hypothetical protein